jgi:hypothetical protein
MSLISALRRSPATILAAAALAVATIALLGSLGGDANAISFEKIGAVKERSKEGTAVGGSFENVEVRCPRGYESISGGVSMNPESAGIVYESVKNEDRGWNTGVLNPEMGDITFFAFVFCAKR